MATYKVITSVPGYYTSLDAKNKRNANSTVKSGTYTVYNEANGMKNLALNNGPGWWINPEENKASKPPTETGSSSGGTKTSTGSGDATNDSSYNGNNDSTQYEKNSHYVASTRDKSSVFYITNMVSGTTMEFDVHPSDISESSPANFNSEEVRGRSTPIVGYSSSGPKSLSYTLHLYDDYCYYGILNTIRFLRGLTYPSYNNGVVTPPKAYMKYGKMISNTCIVKDIGVSWSGPKRDGHHIEATVSLSLEAIAQSPYSVGQIEKGSDYE